MSMKAVAVANPKGGIAKSAVSVNLGHESIEQANRTLLVDFDKQGSLSLAFPRTADPTKRYIKTVDLFGTPDGLVGAELEYVTPTVAIIRAEKEDFEALRALERAPDDFAKRPARVLRELTDKFDVGVFDTPGVIGVPLLAALTAADAVVCPLALGLFETDGLAQLWQIIRQVKSGGFNPKLRMIGMLPSRVNTRDKMAMAELESLRKHPQLGPIILPFMLAERVPVARAINMRKPVWQGAKTASHKAAGQEWKHACSHVLTSLEG